MTIHERYPFMWRESRKKSEVKVTENAEEKLMKTGVESLVLKRRSYNALKRNAVNTISDILTRWAQIPNLNKMGTASFEDVRTALIAFLIENNRTDLIKKLEGETLCSKR